MLCEPIGEKIVVLKSEGLNPCYSGICSVRETSVKSEAQFLVLILVIVEYAL